MELEISSPFLSLRASLENSDHGGGIVASTEALDVLVSNNALGKRAWLHDRLGCCYFYALDVAERLKIS